MKFFKENKIFIAAIIIIAFMYLFLYSAIGKNPFLHDPFDQYTRQAKAWTEGKTYLAEDLSYLEIAEYEGKYYVSFPPVPTIPMLPLYLIFGIDTPNTIMVFIYALLTFIAAFKLLCRKTKKTIAAAIAFFFVFGGSALVISLSGDVWFQAQMLAFLFVTLALYFLFSKKKWHWNLALLFIALSVGCRPLNIIYFVPIYYIIFLNLNNSGKLKSKQKEPFKAKKYLIIALKYLWVPALVGLALMIYNYIRFDSPIVFGHRYLPLFKNESAQFSLKFFFNNLKDTFRLPTYQGNSLSFPKHDGFAFWLSCPFFVYAAIEFVTRKKKVADWIVVAAFLAHFFFTLLHKGMGGFQFGTRYMIDLLPYALILIYTGEIKQRVYAFVLGAFGLMINVYGVAYHYLEW